MPIENDDEPTTLASAPVEPKSRPKAAALKRVERDEESTSFDPRPWGSQQRLLPDRRFARTSGPLQSSSVAPIPSLPAAPQSMARTLSRAPSQRIAFVPAPAKRHPAGFYPVALGPAPAAVMAPAQAFVEAARASASAFADYVVDKTLRVRRSPLTRRSLIAAPLGALVALIVIALVSLGSGSAPHVAGSMQQLSAGEMAPAAVLPAPAPVVAAPLAAPPVAAAQFVAPDSAAPTVEQVEAPVTAPSTHAKPARAHHNRKHRKIVAVDSSTPLGNLRVRRF